jgi:Ca2+-binding EF-hand superfamily protein
METAMVAKPIWIACCWLLLLGACQSSTTLRPDFSVVDTDENGTIEWREFKDMSPDGTPKEFLLVDENKDGVISRGEWRSID